MRKKLLLLAAVVVLGIAAAVLLLSQREKPPATDAGTCTVSISCAQALLHTEELAEGKQDILPSDGWILKPVTVPLAEGDSVFDVLRRAAKEYGILMEYSDTPLFGTAYIEGIANLYERDCGQNSGWIYSVNGERPNYGCSQCAVKAGDEITWEFTCDLGNDLR